jgi:endonuclease/exonuclease/phosphatase family metal-dependent hydrolase
VYVRVRCLTWNLKHGRSVPPSGRDLFEEFAARIAAWDWDMALLQEVPPWWPTPLAHRAGASERHVLTSRNSLLPLRRAIATRWPDAIKSNGGGCDAILIRGLEIVDHRVRRLSLLPERRWVHAVALHEIWVANVHTGASIDQARLAAETAAAWAGERPVIIGGDFNLYAPPLPGFEWAGGHGVDHVFVRGLSTSPQQTRVPDSGHLSDHEPVLVCRLERPHAS